MDLKQELLKKEMDVFTKQLFEFFIESIDSKGKFGNETFTLKVLDSQKKVGKVEIIFINEELTNISCSCLAHKRELVCEHEQIALQAIDILTDRQPDLDEEAIEEITLLMAELSMLNKDRLLNLIADVLEFSEDARMAFFEQLFFRLSLDQKRMFEMPSESNETNVIQFPLGGPTHANHNIRPLIRPESQKEIGEGIKDLSGVDLDRIGKTLSFYDLYVNYEDYNNVQDFDAFDELEMTYGPHMENMQGYLYTGDIPKANAAILHGFLYLLDKIEYANSRKEYIACLEDLTPFKFHPYGQRLIQVFLDELLRLYPKRKALREEIQHYLKK